MNYFFLNIKNAKHIMIYTGCTSDNGMKNKTILICLMCANFDVFIREIKICLLCKDPKKMNFRYVPSIVCAVKFVVELAMNFSVQ